MRPAAAATSGRQQGGELLGHAASTTQRWWWSRGVRRRTNSVTMRARTPRGGRAATSGRRRPRRVSGHGSGPPNPQLSGGKPRNRALRRRAAPAPKCAMAGGRGAEGSRWRGRGRCCAWSCVVRHVPMAAARSSGPGDRSPDGPADWRCPQTRSGSHGIWKSQTYQLRSTCGSSRSLPLQRHADAAEVVQRGTAAGGVRRQATLEPRVPRLGGDHVPACDRPPVVPDEVDAFAGREGRVEHRDQVLDEQGGAVRRSPASDGWSAPTRGRRR